MFDELAADETKLQGQLIGIAGNLAALSKSKRFISQDLNRIWDNELLASVPGIIYYANNGQLPNQIEQREIFAIIEALLELSRPIYFY